MGFSAKSADQVYRYALRMDAPSRSLTDQFCLSLIVVNDHSLVCQEFLTDYFVDLCHRTADRIRFVFFADIHPHMVRDLERQMHDNLVKSKWNSDCARGGFLGSLIARLFGHRQPELHGWNRLTPPALFGISSPEETHARLGFTRDSGSVVIKPGEAIAFAQRLGIGRHVPCIVVVTDVGALDVEVFPFGSRTANEVYSRVRQWVDQFYHLNRSLLDHWHQVEDEIIDLRHKADLALSEVREWRDKARVPAQAAAEVNNLIDRIFALPVEDCVGFAAAVESGWKSGHADRVRTLSKEALEHLVRLDQLSTMVSTGEVLREKLSTGSGNADAVQSAIEAAMASPCLPQDIAAHLRASVTDLRNWIALLGDGPDEHLVRWWRDCVCHSRPTETGYKKARRRWSISTAGIDFGREHGFLLASISRVQVFNDPDESAEQIFRDVAVNLGANPADKKWTAECRGYRQLVRDYVARCQQGAPEWVRNRFEHINFGKLFPAASDYPKLEDVLAGVRDQSLPKEHPLTHLLTVDCDSWDSMNIKWKQARHMACEAAVRAVRAVLDMFPRQPPGPANVEAVRATLLAGLQAARAGYEHEVTRLEQEVRAGTPIRTRIEPHILIRLHATLERYEEAVTRIRYPHREDPDVCRLSLPACLPDMVGINAPSDPYQGGKPPGNLKESLLLALGETRQLCEQADQQATELPKLPPRWTPAAILAEAISATLPSERIEEVLPPGLPGDQIHRIRNALAEYRVRETLGRLTDAELGIVLQAVSRPARASENSRLSRFQRIELLLSRVGADVRPPLLGEANLLRRLNVLDAELDGLTDEEVTLNGTEIRRSAEQYLKQFLVLYGPVGLTSDERESLVNQTLGPLTTLTIRVLKAGEESAGEESIRYLVERIRGVHGTGGWKDAISDLLPRLAALSNIFPHHIVRGGLELTPAERRARLTDLSRTTRDIVERFRDANLYPICLRFSNIRPDSMYTCRFEFESDPPVGGHELLAFSQFPPRLYGVSGDLLSALYRQILLMLPVRNPERLDPILVPVRW